MSGGVIGKVSDGTNTHLLTNTFYATCSTGSDTADKVAQLVDSSVNSLTLITGMLLSVKFTHTNTVLGDITLKLQTSGGVDLTTAKQITMASFLTASQGAWDDNSIVTFIYDGIRWVQTRAFAMTNNGVYIQDIEGTVDIAALNTAIGRGDIILGRVVGPNNETWYYNLIYQHGAGYLVFQRIQQTNGPYPLEYSSDDHVIDTITYTTDAYGNEHWSQTGINIIEDIKIDGTSTLSTDSYGVTTSNIVTSSAHPYDASSNPLATVADVGAAGGGTVTSVGLTNATDGGLTISSSPVTTSGNITVGHSNVLSSAQNILGLYPIKIDKNGHITSYGSAVTINDTKVLQRQITDDDEYEVLLATGTGSSDITDIAYRASGVTVNPDDNSLSASTFYGNLQVQGEAVTPASSDYILISDATATNLLKRGIAIGSSTTTYLRNDGTWQTPPNTITSWYGTCSTTASTAQKDVTCSNYVLNTGNIIGVYFSTANTAATPTLKVGSTAAKSIYVGNTTPTSTTNVLKWSAKTMVYFIYDGTCYRYLYATAEASVAPPRGANTWYGTSSTTASTQNKTSTIDNYVLTKGSLVVINFSTANTYAIAKITLNINSTGAKDIYYNNAVTSNTNPLLWDANTTIVFVYDGTGYTYLCRSKIVSANDGTLKLQKNSDTASSLFTANQSGDSTLKYTTTSVGSASGWNAGSTPSLGTAIPADDITAWTTNTPTAIDTSKFNGGSFTQGTDSFTAATHGNDSFTAATLTMSGGGSTASAASTLTVSFSGGSFTQGTFNGGSFTQGTDSHTAASLSSGFYTAGTAASLSYNSKSIPNVTSVGTAPSLTVTSTTVVNDITSS